jgi:hypothetical protein
VAFAASASAESGRLKRANDPFRNASACCKGEPPLAGEIPYTCALSSSRVGLRGDGVCGGVSPSVSSPSSDDDSADDPAWCSSSSEPLELASENGAPLPSSSHPPHCVSAVALAHSTTFWAVGDGSEGSRSIA